MNDRPPLSGDDASVTRILSVEDDPGDAELIRTYLKRAPQLSACLEWADSLGSGLTQLDLAPFDIVLLDLFLPDGWGLDVFCKIHAHRPDLPVVVLSGLEDEEEAIRALQAGAQDYLVKGRFDGQLLARSIRYGIERQQLLSRLARLNEDLEQRVRDRTLALEKANQNLRAEIAIRRAVETELRQSEEKFRQLAENLDGVVWLRDLLADRMLYVSPTCQGLWGYGSEVLEDWRGFLEIVHPDDRDLVSRVWATRSRADSDVEYRIVRADGQVRWIRDRAFPIADDSGKPYRMAGIVEDVTRRHTAEAQLRYNASHDDLTGLLNRRALLDALERAIARHRNSQLGFALLALDLDRFKNVNDSLGHALGDRLLRDAARRLQGCLRSCDWAARFGGDEFTILLADLTDPRAAIPLAREIARAIDEPFLVGGQQVFLSTSIGIVLSSDLDLQTPQDVLRNADIALYQAKANGRGRYEVFDRDMYVRVADRLQLEADLRRGLDRGEFVAHYQPIVSLVTNRPVGFEALVRWYHPERGLVSPGQFVPLAEETGAIVALDWCVLRQACAQLRRWQTQFPDLGLRFVSVNFSSLQFAQVDCVAQLTAILQETGLAFGSLKLEITERTLLGHTPTIEKTLQAIRALGVEFSIDDFGTGYSSLGYLHRFPIDTIKIDRSFTCALGGDAVADGAATDSQAIAGQGTERTASKDKGRESQGTETPAIALGKPFRSHNPRREQQAIVSAIVALAESLNLDTVAEGVETEEQLEILRSLGCANVQGFWFAPALSVERAEAFLEGFR